MLKLVKTHLMHGACGWGNCYATHEPKKVLGSAFTSTRYPLLMGPGGQLESPVVRARKTRTSSMKAIMKSKKLHAPRTEVRPDHPRLRKRTSVESVRKVGRDYSGHVMWAIWPRFFLSASGAFSGLWAGPGVVATSLEVQEDDRESYFFPPLLVLETWDGRMPHFFLAFGLDR